VGKTTSLNPVIYYPGFLTPQKRIGLNSISDPTKGIIPRQKLKVKETPGLIIPHYTQGNFL